MLVIPKLVLTLAIALKCPVLLISETRRYHTRPLGSRPQPSSDRYPSSSSPHTSSHRAQGTQRKRGLRDRFCRVEEGRERYDIIFSLHTPEARKTWLTNPLMWFEDKLLDFTNFHIHSADDHLVRWKWSVGAVAMWDNRCTLHRVIPGKYASGTRRGVRTTVFGEKRKLESYLQMDIALVLIFHLAYFDPNSESREEREGRSIGSVQEKSVNGITG